MGVSTRPGPLNFGPDLKHYFAGAAQTGRADGPPGPCRALTGTFTRIHSCCPEIM